MNKINKKKKKYAPVQFLVILTNFYVNSTSGFNFSSNLENLLMLFLESLSLFHYSVYISIELFVATNNVRVILASSLIWYSILLLAETRLNFVAGKTSSEIDRIPTTL